MLSIIICLICASRWLQDENWKLYFIGAIQLLSALLLHVHQLLQLMNMDKQSTHQDWSYTFSKTRIVLNSTSSVMDSLRRKTVPFSNHGNHSLWEGAISQLGVEFFLCNLVLMTTGSTLRETSKKWCWQYRRRNNMNVRERSWLT